MKFKDAREFSYTWLNNGRLPSDPKIRVSIKDAISTPNALMWLPKVIQQIVREAVEPLLVGTRLLQRVEYHAGQTITFPAVGALEAADIAEGQAYPEKQLSMGGATVTATIGKSGVMVKITQEMIRWSQYDVINMHIRQGGRALARHKEKKIFNHIRSLGVTCFDNLNPTNSIFGPTHGRALDGSANGSVVADDLFDVYGHIMTQGFMPDTILVHPLTWSMFMKDPVLRSIALAGGMAPWFGSYTGNVASRAPWDNASQGGLGPSSGQSIAPGENAGGQKATPIEGYSQTMTSAPSLPRYFPFPLRVIVSPFVPFDPATKLTDIYMFDSAELGVLIVDEDVRIDEWNDPAVDIHRIKMYERYAIGILNEGLAIGLLKNVKVVPNEVVSVAQPSISVSGSLTQISPTTPVV